MAEIRLGTADNVYEQTVANRDVYNNVFGEDGNDVLKLYAGTALGGKGNDRIERVIYQGESWRYVGVAYWDSPSGVRVDLAEGWAEDGFGTRDVLVNIQFVTGSSYNDWLKGNELNNDFSTNGGTDTVLGGGGTDTVFPWYQSPDVFRLPLLSELRVQTALDGLSAVIEPLVGRPFKVSTTDVERIAVWDGGYDVNGNRSTITYLLNDFITPQQMAEQAIAAGGHLRWNAASPLGTPVALTYSFVVQEPASGPGAVGFRSFNESEKTAVRAALASAAAVSGLSFSEVAEQGGSVGQLRFGASVQFASKGLSWLPNQAGAGDQAGDVWMDTDTLTQLTPGSEGWQALLHEIGHALGLRHPRNVDPGDSWPTQLLPSDDRLSLTVMSDQASSDGLFRSDWGPLDVLALRHLYGSRAVNSSDTVYRLDASHANAETTLQDDGGTDTLDASALNAGATLDLRPGQLSNVGLNRAGIAGVENLGLTASTWIENAIGTPWDDVLTGNDLANRLSGGTGNDRIDGGKGLDTAVFDSPRAGYEVSGNSTQASVKARDGVSGFDSLLNVERLQFKDGWLALDINGPAGTVAAIIRAVFGASFLSTREYVGIGLNLLDGGMTPARLAELAMATPLVADLAGSHSHADAVRLLYRNALGSTPTAEQAAPYVAMLNNGSQTQGSLALMVAQHPVITGSVELLGLQTTGIEYLPPGG